MFVEETEWPHSEDMDDDGEVPTPGSRPGRTPSQMSIFRGGYPEVKNQSQPGMVMGKTLKELSEQKPQYQVTFSVEFGQDMLQDESERPGWAPPGKVVQRFISDLYKQAKINSSEDGVDQEWLRSQYFSLQRYMRGVENTSKQPVTEPVRIFRVQSVYGDEKLKPIVDTNMMLTIPNLFKGGDEKAAPEVNRQVQFLNHITDYHKRQSDSKAPAAQRDAKTVHFLVSNMFVLVEIEVTQ